ncbi:MAG: DUF58 domain-containing protein [Mobilicoccus sp.]|nr:DUF58 domain-containing protein [Mobilicoccus sp.]
MTADPRRWHLTPAHAAIAGAGVLLAVVAVITRRSELLVVAVPLLTWAALGLVARPTALDRLQVHLDPATPTEGAPASVIVTSSVPASVESVGVDLAPGPRIATDPPGGAVHGFVTPGEAAVAIEVRADIWGHYRLGGGEVRLTSDWGAYIARDTVPELALMVFPAPHLPTGGTGDVLPPATLLGRHISRRPGDGSEFAEVRPFRAGDRIRRVHWPTSARKGDLHVRTHLAERDADLLVVVDALGDLPSADPTLPSSVEAAVQIAAAAAARACRGGDRVGLRILGDRSRHLRAGTGERHLRRVLALLARVRPADERNPDPRSVHRALRDGTVLIAATPLTSRVVVDAIAAAARRGTDVVVIDVVPDRVDATAGEDTLAWRILELERRVTVDRLRDLGVPVVPFTDGITGVLQALRARRQARR